MRARSILIIAAKELREALRDRRTLFLAIGLPVLVYPLAILGMSKLQENQQAAQSARVSNVAVWGRVPAPLAQQLTDRKLVEWQEWTHVPEGVRAALERGLVTAPPPEPLPLDADEERKPPTLPDEDWARAAREAVLARKTDAVLVLWAGFEEQVAAGAAGSASVLYDSVRPESVKARDRLTDALRLYRQELLKQREAAGGLRPGFTRGLEIQTRNVSPQQRQSANLLGMMLPYLLIVFSVMGGFYAAIDMTAGEKERGTMQTLLCAPLLPLEIITGKFLAVFTISLIGTVVNLTSLAATFRRVKLMPGAQLSLSLETALLAFLLLLPITMMVTGLYLAIGAFARDFKDGQNYLTPLLMGLILPAMVTMAPGMELNAHLAFVPIVNIALLIKTVLLQEWQAEMVFLVLISSFCYASLALVLAARIFERNNLLLGGKETASAVLDFRRQPGARPTPGVSLLVFSLVLVLAFYASVALEKQKLPVSLAVIQYGFFLMPALALVGLKGFDWRETLRLRPLPVLAVLGSVLVGLSAWTVGAGVLIRLLPPPPSLLKALERVLMMKDEPQMPVAMILFLVALTPALCEETLFRGLIQSGFRSLGMWPAIICTGLLFGLAHASIYRLLPTFFLGVVFGFVVWRTGSLYAGIICHALNNGLMVLLATQKPLQEQFRVVTGVFLPWEYTAAGAMLLAAGLFLVVRSQPAAPSTTA
jgi:sodium transport system permease protein